MKGLLLILSVIAVVMVADAYNGRSRSDWAEIFGAQNRVAELRAEIEALEGSDFQRGSSKGLSDLDKRLHNFYVRCNVDGVAGVTKADFDVILGVVESVQPAAVPEHITYVRKAVALMAEYFFDCFKSEEDWTAYVKSPLFADWSNGVFPVFFFAVDENCDGQVTFDEYTRVYKALFDNNDDYATKSFNAMKGSDGVISMWEYFNYSASYFRQNIDPKVLYYWGTLKA